MQNIWLIHLLRFFTFFLSLVAFSCHLAQCLLFNAYQEKSGIPDWLSAGHWQYLTWYISLGLSLLSGIAVCSAPCLLRQAVRFSIDKCVGSVVLLPVLCSIITALLFDSLEPWTNGHVKFERPPSGLLTYCTLLDESRDKFYPILFQRCILSDITWISALAVCGIWVLLVGCIIGMSFHKQKEISGIAGSANEPKWGRYIPDPPVNYPRFHHQSMNYSSLADKNRKGGGFYIENKLPPVYNNTAFLENVKQDLQNGGGYSTINDPANTISCYEDAYSVESTVRCTPTFALEREHIPYTGSSPYYSIDEYPLKKTSA